MSLTLLPFQQTVLDPPQTRVDNGQSNEYPGPMTPITCSALLAYIGMNDDEYEKLRLKNEFEQLKRERESEKKSRWVVWFLAIWLLPLLGMLLVQGDDLPKTAGPAFPVVGHMSIWGMWFLGVPLATFLYRRFMR